MNTIQEGVKIYLAGDCTEINRVWINRGTVPAIGLSEESYETGALVPALNWRKPDSAELKILMQNDAEPDYNMTVGVIRLPEGLIDQLNEFGISGFDSVLELSEHIEKNPVAFNRIREGFRDVIGKHSYIENGFVIHDILINSGNRLSTTINLNTNQFTGLHIDFWDQLSLGKIDDARNRISFNLSKSVRYFVFVNLTISQILEKLSHETDIKGFNQERVLKEFLKRNPEYPVVKVKVEPFEGYIAPTENLIHDGSTLGSSGKDIQLFTRGYFSITKLSDSFSLTNEQ